MLTSKQKKYLRSESHNLNAIFQIGKDGVSNKQTDSINDALKAHELVKVKLLQTCPQDVNEVAIEISRKTNADVVHIIGHTITFYKQSEKRIYKLP